LFFRSSSDYFANMLYKLSVILPFFILNACTYSPPTTGEMSSSSGEPTSPPPMSVPCLSSCSCALPEGCTFGCGNTGCKPATCNGTYCEGICGFGNSCVIDCDNSECGFTCLSTACQMKCSNNSSCDLGCQEGGCVISCESGSDCHANCNGPGSPCVINCSDGATATCDGTCTMTGCK
jgi:hypothetical protein